MTTPKKDTSKSNYKITTIVYKQIGRNLNVKIRKNLLTKVGTTEELLPLKELINKYNDTKSPLVAEKLENKILELLTSTKTKEDNKEKIEKSIVKSKLKKATKDLVYGGMLELMRNRTYYYHSTVGSEYSHWTEEGKEALAEYMNFMAFKMLQAEEADLRKRAKEMTMNSLKGESV